MKRGHIARNDRPRSDHSSVANSYSLQNDCVRTNEYATPDYYRPRSDAAIGCPLPISNRVVKVVVHDEHAGADECVFSDDDLRPGTNGGAAHPDAFIQPEFRPRDKGPQDSGPG